MARSGRSTRTVRIADRLTLCPSREYSIMLQGKREEVSGHRMQHEHEAVGWVSSSWCAVGMGYNGYSHLRRAADTHASSMVHGQLTGMHLGSFCSSRTWHNRELQIRDTELGLPMAHPCCYLIVHSSTSMRCSDVTPPALIPVHFHTSLSILLWPKCE